MLFTSRGNFIVIQILRNNVYNRDAFSIFFTNEKKVLAIEISHFQTKIKAHQNVSFNLRDIFEIFSREDVVAYRISSIRCYVLLELIERKSKILSRNRVNQ